MAEYYLVSQLPSLDGLGDNVPLPITEERFLELCRQLLGEKALNELEGITLVPTKKLEKSASALIDGWNEGERDLRLALCKARADKMNKPFDLQNRSLALELLKVANAAVEIENPLEAENFLLRYRLDFLETLRPMDGFSLDYIFYYALKLKLLSRVRQFDTTLGENTYKEIYNSILNGERLED